jgi:hypothetical protein|tara:strand:+ start:7217 stop:7459 length:243 start_codon:yes stop_codon:yes gene_type:complete
MTYYLLLEGDTEKDTHLDTNVLGEESFGTFYAGQGMVALKNIVNNKAELLESLRIFDETKKSYTITEFMDVLSKLKVITH